MITRIVKMTFKPDDIASFKTIFSKSHDKIRQFEGCKELVLVQDIHNNCIFFTISHWESDKHLQSYRKSTLFQTTWNKTKVLFSEKAMAWSTKEPGF